MKKGLQHAKKKIFNLMEVAQQLAKSCLEQTGVDEW